MKTLVFRPKTGSINSGTILVTAVLITGTVITDSGCAAPIIIILKGAVPRDFRLQVFYIDQFP
jgi:hypothetical protein